MHRQFKSEGFRVHGLSDQEIKEILTQIAPASVITRCAGHRQGSRLPFTAYISVKERRHEYRYVHFATKSEAATFFDMHASGSLMSKCELPSKMASEWNM
ncbi:hypothetical protein O0I10_003385 [Lichtheimia ornata]|uniref:Uncharacterized protein n=1 Tax=Lichtheimia ornata TaxID=688661 RepID=A0AAD7Y2I0_9FUNG|nr:uncharacterized protein O0I10_003385 [Lichtheimia ornata]KAJ8660742.1 hypothetical protein O0I10_003385 [Lichtheimia ornata]